MGGPLPGCCCPPRKMWTTTERLSFVSPTTPPRALWAGAACWFLNGDCCPIGCKQRSCPVNAQHWIILASQPYTGSLRIVALFHPIQVGCVRHLVLGALYFTTLVLVFFDTPGSSRAESCLLCWQHDFCEENTCRKTTRAIHCVYLSPDLNFREGRETLSRNDPCVKTGSLAART